MQQKMLPVHDHTRTRDAVGVFWKLWSINFGQENPYLHDLNFRVDSFASYGFEITNTCRSSCRTTLPNPNLYTNKPFDWTWAQGPKQTLISIAQTAKTVIVEKLSSSSQNAANAPSPSYAHLRFQKATRCLGVHCQHTSLYRLGRNLTHVNTMCVGYSVRTVCACERNKYTPPLWFDVGPKSARAALHMKKFLPEIWSWT